MDIYFLLLSWYSRLLFFVQIFFLSNIFFFSLNSAHFFQLIEWLIRMAGFFYFHYLRNGVLLSLIFTHKCKIEYKVSLVDFSLMENSQLLLKITSFHTELVTFCRSWKLQQLHLFYYFVRRAQVLNSYLTEAVEIQISTFPYSSSPSVSATLFTFIILFIIRLTDCYEWLINIFSSWFSIVYLNVSISFLFY